jgi:hypothetical protein
MSRTSRTAAAGQNHDRLGNDGMAMETMMDTEPGIGSAASVEITMGQKMLSAMSGSLVTSLLGEFTQLQCGPPVELVVLITSN